MKRGGLTLIELLVAALISAIIVGAVGSAYVTGIGFEKSSAAARERSETRTLFESKLRTLLQGAYVSSDEQDLMTYFTAQNSDSSGSVSGSNTLTFTTTSNGINNVVLTSDDDFETQNQKYGPQGGIAEISLSTTAVGDPGTKQGLFLREQRPADGDATQGGTESLLNADIDSIGFEFYDGTDWVTQWDTQTQGSRRIPAAVRITYLLNGDDTNHVIVVGLQNSDVTAANPYIAGDATP